MQSALTRMAVELMSFGTLHNLLKGFSRSLREVIANEYGIHEVVLNSWFLSLNVLRNLCAHHSRVWNRVFGFRPVIPKKDPLWNIPFAIPNQRLFGFASVIAYLCTRIEGNDNWKRRFLDLLVQQRNILPRDLGFPYGWENHGIWK